MAADTHSPRCARCEGGAPRLPDVVVRARLPRLAGWTLCDDGTRIRRDVRARNFAAALELARRIGDLAEQEGHHPDLHLIRYRQLGVALSTHAAGGLTENDFILAEMIDALVAGFGGEPAVAVDPRETRVEALRRACEERLARLAVTEAEELRRSMEGRYPNLPFFYERERAVYSFGVRLLKEVQQPTGAMELLFP